jgi:hypothetical protein
MIVHNGKTFSIYCVADNSKIVSQYKLNNLPQMFTPYNLEDKHENSLDNLSLFFGDLSAQYFVYKNDIKSDYVGFCQYNNIPQFDIDNFIKENGVSLGYTIADANLQTFFDIPFNKFLKEDFYTYITKNYKKTSRIYKYFIKNKNANVPYYIGRMYVCKWDIFEEIMGCVIGFIEYINETYELNYDPNEWKYFIFDNFIDDKLTKGIPQSESFLLGDNARNLWRILMFITEIIIGTYFGNLVTELNLPQYSFNPNEDDKSE